MRSVLLIGGTGFVGSHTAEEFLRAGFDVTVLSRVGGGEGRIDPDVVTTVLGDRDDPETVRRVADEPSPDVVVDLVGMYPRHIDEALTVFGDCDADVYVSSASAYAQPVRLPSREGDPLHDYDPESETDESWGSRYSTRKAECDRRCRAAARDGAAAMVVRPVAVYGPGDWGERHDYWFHRVWTFDTIVVPGDGDSTFHRVFVGDLARAIRIVAEDGVAGEAYNVAERDTAWLDRTVELAAETLETSVDIVHASERELARGGLSPFDFPLYLPIPHVAASAKLAALGWASTPLEETFAVTIEDHLASDRTGANPPRHEFGVERPAEERLIDSLAG